MKRNMKSAIFLIISIIIIGAILLLRNKDKPTNVPMNFVFLDDKINEEDLLPSVDNNWLQSVETEYAQKEYDRYKSKHSEFSKKLCNDVYSSYKYWEKKETHAAFLNKLTNEQKMYFALVNFESQVNNGGVYQFLFNQPENSIIVLEGMKMAGMTRLAKDYEIVLNQFFGKFDTIQELRNRFKTTNLDWEKRWNAVVEGYEELPAAETIEEYFYDIEFKKEFHTNMENFVVQHQNGLFKIE